MRRSRVQHATLVQTVPAHLMAHDGLRTPWKSSLTSDGALPHELQPYITNSSLTNSRSETDRMEPAAGAVVEPRQSS
jgi:hypothetical protein